jgi:thioredoxin:protein disulfide reductase
VADRWLAAACLAAALVLAAPAQGAGPKLLPADQAFRLSARALDASSIEVRFNVADGYYLYRDKLKFAVEPASAGVGAPALPQGIPHQDEFFGKVVTYRGLVVIRLPLAAGQPGQSVTLVADSQGCADAGVCYPPQLQRLALMLPAAGAAPGAPVEATLPRKGYFP